MSEFNENLSELYLNYDTANLLKNDTDKNDIISMFKSELDYPEELTSCFLNLNKSFLNSVIMRIKVRKKTLQNKDIKDDLLNFNKDISPILDKLLSNSEFIETHNKIKVEEKIEQKIESNEVSEKVEAKDEKGGESYEKVETIEKFFEEWVIKTKDDSDFMKVSEFYDNYCDYCLENSFTKEAKSSFKEYLTVKLGKPVNNGYKKYKIIDEE